MTFPEKLDGVSAAKQLKQKFGFMAASWAVAALIALVALNFEPVQKNDRLIAVMGIFAACAVFELWQRSRPYVLVTEGTRVGVYRAGKLVRETESQGIGELVMSPFNTWRAHLAFGPAALIFLWLALADWKTGQTTWVYWVAGAVGALGSSASTFYLRGKSRLLFVEKSEVEDDAIPFPVSVSGVGFSQRAGEGS